MRSLMKTRNKNGLKTLPRGTPALTRRGYETILLRAKRWLRSGGSQWFMRVGSLGCHKQRVWILRWGARLYQILEICPEMQMSCLRLRASIHCWESQSSISKVEWPGLKPNWWSKIWSLEKRKDCNYRFCDLAHHQKQANLPAVKRICFCTMFVNYNNVG